MPRITRGPRGAPRPPRPPAVGPPGILHDTEYVDGRPLRIRFTRRGWRLVVAFFVLLALAALVWPDLWWLFLFWLVMLLCRNWLPWLPSQE